jgi:hypothetical protein
VLREDPLETPRAGVDRALPDDEFKPIPFFQAVYDQAVQNGVDMTVPSYYYAEMRSGIESELTNAQTMLAAYEELARDLNKISRVILDLRSTAQAQHWSSAMLAQTSERAGPGRR